MIEYKKPKAYIKPKKAKILPANIPFNKCPECNSEITHDEEHCIDQCTKCGLITRASTYYHHGQKINYPYGLLII